MSKIQGITPREAARRLGIRLDATYALLWAGKLVAHQKEGRWRVSAAAVEERRKAKGGKDGTARR
jgi:excisionase family DNA binding protein